MTEVLSVNGKTGVVILTPTDVEAIPASSAGAASGVATLNGSGALSEAQLPSAVVRSSANPEAEAEAPQSTGSGSRAVIWRKKPYVDARDKGVAGRGEAGEGAALQAAVTAAAERKMDLLLPGEGAVIRVDSQVKLENVEEWRMRGSGGGTVLEDKVTSGPCLAYLNSGGTPGKPVWRDFVIALATSKPLHYMVEWNGLRSSRLDLHGVRWLGESTNKCKAGLYMKNMWEGSFDDCIWSQLLGHSLWYDCPELNGGNIGFNDCVDTFCLNGMYIAGSDTTNNIKLGNYKWVSAAGGETPDGHEFYQAKTTGIPAVSAEEITLEAGVEAVYFPANGCVGLYSAAGLEIVHIANIAEPYNAATGVLKLATPVTLNHAEYSDLRVICATFSLITNFIVPNLVLDCCHMEQRPAWLHEASCYAPGLELNLNQKSNRGLPVGLYLSGRYGAKTPSLTMSHSFELYSEYSAAYLMTPAPSENTGVPAFDYDWVGTRPQGEAQQAGHAKWKILSGDSTATGFTRSKGRTQSRGVEFNQNQGELGWRSLREVAGTGNFTVERNDELIHVGNLTGERTGTLLKAKNKRVTIRLAGTTSGHKLIITAGAGSKIRPESEAGEGTETIELTAQNQKVTLWCDGSNFFRE